MNRTHSQEKWSSTSNSVMASLNCSRVAPQHMKTCRAVLLMLCLDLHATSHRRLCSPLRISEAWMQHARSCQSIVMKNRFICILEYQTPSNKNHVRSYIENAMLSFGYTRRNIHTRSHSHSHSHMNMHRSVSHRITASAVCSIPFGVFVDLSSVVSLVRAVGCV